MMRLLLTACLFLVPLGALAAGPFTSLHPEEAIPDSVEKPSPGPYSEFISRVQERLRALGFNAGPVNGDFGEKTQAALAQFQLSATIPASGALDAQTLLELGVARDVEAASGASADSSKPEPGPGEKPAS